MARKTATRSRTRVRSIRESDEDSSSVKEKSKGRKKKDPAPKKEKQPKQKKSAPGVPLGRDIIKAKIVDGEFLFIEYTENIPNLPIAEVSRDCTSRIHKDLQAAIDQLIPHFGNLTELAPNRSPNYTFDQFAKNGENTDVFKVLKVTGYTISGPAEARGVTIIGQKILSSGKVVNFISPFQKFSDQAAPYIYSSELTDTIANCQSEVDAYLKGKVAPDPQQKLAFEEDKKSAEA